MAIGQKTGGRTIGTPNKITQDVREQFNLLLEKNYAQLEADINSLSPRWRVHYILELTKFIAPTLRATEMEVTHPDEEPHEITINIIRPKDNLIEGVDSK